MKLNIFKGQSLFEVVFAIGIAAIVITGVTIVATISVRNSTYSKNNAIATKYTQEQLEWLRGQRDAGWIAFTTNIGPACSGTFSWGAECLVDSLFKRKATYTCKDSSENNVACTPSAVMVDVTVEVSWSDSQGNHTVNSSTRFTNWNR